MELRLLATFKAVAERLHFTRAAEELHLAQSSVSAQIRQLEDELGVQLFDRIGRRIILTDAGEKLLGYARRMIVMTNEIHHELSDNKVQTGHLTIRTPETVATECMPAVVDAFHALHPQAELSFINCDDTRLREELNSGRIDLAFLMTDSVSMQHVHVEMLQTIPLLLTAAPQHPLAGQRSISSQAMQGQTILHLRVD